jgi:hypothetical protein
MALDASLVRVIHRHRIGRYSFTRVSPLTYVAEQPVAVILWLHDGGGRVPGVCVPLDKAKLRRGATRRIFVYDGETTDPRVEPVGPA